MLESADKNSLLSITVYLTDKELLTLLRTCKTLHKKLTSIPQIEIRVLKFRLKGAEGCLDVIGC